ncbi:MAG TPA: hypothetical protein VHX60_02980 [Acidobacteriaceae bacterium]|jgi:hypothetical protein|nr:hypothetical protein [Acidobacteriaceae bacterium]
MTPTRSNTTETEVEAPVRPRSRRNRTIVFKSFTAIPTTAAQACLGLSDAALRLWLTLALASKGASRTVTMGNTELMSAARVTKSRFYPARRELQDATVLTFTPADGRRESYVYDLEPAPKMQPTIKRRPKVSHTTQTRRGAIENVLGSNSMVNSWGDA